MTSSETGPPHVGHSNEGGDARLFRTSSSGIVRKGPQASHRNSNSDMDTAPQQGDEPHGPGHVYLAPFRLRRQGLVGITRRADTAEVPAPLDAANDGSTPR